MISTLERCLKSCIEQTISEIEIICVDNNSTDNSRQIVEEYIKKDSRIILYCEKRKGASYARNYGIRMAKGQFVFFLDADDTISEKDSLEILYKIAIDSNSNICGGIIQYIDKQENVDTLLTENQPLYGLIAKYNEYTMIDYKEYQYDYGYYSFLYRRAFLLEKGLLFPNYIRHQDPPFFVKAMEAAKYFAAVNKHVYSYRYSYKPIVLNRQSAIDVIDATIEIVNIAQNNGYTKLINYCIGHFNEGYCMQLLLNLSFESLQKLIELKKMCENPSIRVIDELLLLYSKNIEKNQMLDNQLAIVRRQSEIIKEKEERIEEQKQKIGRQAEIIKSKMLWKFPAELFNDKSRVLIYGAGKVGRHIYEQAKESKTYVVELTDKKYKELQLISPEQAIKKKPDYILIATIKKEYEEEICEQIRKYNIAGAKIVSYFNWINNCESVFIDA